MARVKERKKPGMTTAQINAELLRALTERNYKPAEARELIEAAWVMARGRHAPIGVRIHKRDAENVTRALMTIKETPEAAKKILAELRIFGPGKPVAIIWSPAPRPIETYLYDVTVKGQKYRIETKTGIRGRGRVVKLKDSRVGQLMTALNEGKVIAVTDARGNSVPKREFRRIYGSVYRALEKERELTNNLIARRIKIEERRRKKA